MLVVLRLGKSFLCLGANLAVRERWEREWAKREIKNKAIANFRKGIAIANSDKSDNKAEEALILAYYLRDRLGLRLVEIRELKNEEIMAEAKMITDVSEQVRQLIAKSASSSEELGN
jgi:hypothetical protein